MEFGEIITIVSAILSVVTGPVVFLAISSIHETKTTKLIKEAFSEERERSKDIFALKSEVSEMKGYVTQLVSETRVLGEKLDNLHQLILGIKKN